MNKSRTDSQIRLRANWLTLEGRAVTDATLLHLRTFDNLRPQLVLNGCAITDDGLKSLAQLEALERVTLRGGMRHLRAGAAALREARPDIVVER